jgi:curli biogenesis system outer membrane secretion channel CsgG
MRRSLTLRLASTAGCLALFCAIACSQDVAAKRRIAVLNFESPNVGPDAPAGFFGADAEEVGRGVSALLIEKLLKDGKYTVIDRSTLEEALKQQSENDRKETDAYAMAARVGRLLGLDAMIIGAITRYAVDDKKGSGGVVSSGMHTRKSKAFVEITARVFNVSTAEVMAEFKGKGESEQPGVVTTMQSKGHAQKAVQMLGSEFAESLFPEATRHAVEQIAAQVSDFADRIPAMQANPAAALTPRIAAGDDSRADTPTASNPFRSAARNADASN